ncbi:MAG: hypothetical protein ABSF48_28700 [Thermodesulfobacteriota bacterium]|jgi:hypothetical protein
MLKITRKLGGIYLSLLLLMILAGCAGEGKQTKPQAIQRMRTDIFFEGKGEQPPPAGTVDLTIKASVKIPTREHFLLESRTPPPTEGGYPFELNIGGQEIVWKVEGTLEKTPISDEKGRTPEGGEGIRYVLGKKIRLAPGAHHVVFGVPYDDYYTEVKVSLKEGEPHTLEFQPIYSTGRRGYETFHRGISRTRVLLDGVRIK